ncbi:flagellar basal body rod protein FlgC [Pseudoxanthomonas composti]|uniref:Flagellar basal-body rod protein FlgC n=1 Tax=Pseudoxanthomonas composti TaxID=2137479 RepID=A0A4Q1JU13_9GAMM|nr:flagellar basal body rod protein FlgC [Pseudoxanthomonas composti]RXR02682.1 flagellar basal body rod protein FlgC [Pseudoxanthomonas composti]
MSNLPIFDVAGSALQAQSVRLSTIASNLANADAVAGTPEAAYKPIEPIFQTTRPSPDKVLAGVEVKEIQESQAAPLKRYDPGHPLADPEGYVYAPDVDPVSQMVNMISASRNYQAGVEIMNTAKELALSTLTMGR